MYTCNKDAVDKTHTSPHLNARLHQLYKNAVCTSIKHVLNAGLHSSKILETIAENKLATSKINKYFQKTISSTLNEITVNLRMMDFRKAEQNLPSRLTEERWTKLSTVIILTQQSLL